MLGSITSSVMAEPGRPIKLLMKTPAAQGCAKRRTPPDVFDKAKLPKFLLLLQRDARLHARLHLVDDHGQDDDQAFDHLLPEG